MRQRMDDDLRVPYVHLAPQCGIAQAQGRGQDLKRRLSVHIPRAQRGHRAQAGVPTEGQYKHLLHLQTAPHRKRQGGRREIWSGGCVAGENFATLGTLTCQSMLRSNSHRFAKQNATGSSISPPHLKKSAVPNLCPKTMDHQYAVPLESSLPCRHT